MQETDYILNNNRILQKQIYGKKIEKRGDYD
jgi:hypothetical protein